jgi:hypothetical protein
MKPRHPCGIDKGLPTYTSTRLINASLARVPGNVTKFVPRPCVMHSNRDGLRYKVLGRLLAVLNGDRRRRRVRRPGLITVLDIFRGRGQRQAGRCADTLIVDELVQIHGVRRRQNLLRRFAKLCYPTWRVERGAGEAV